MDADEAGPARADDAYPVTPRTQVRRRAQRGRYDRASVHAILDEGLVCHVGFVADGEPFVIPTADARAGETLYLHGSPASQMLRSLAGGLPVCVTVTLVDGIVLARSAFHHSMNYRSVVAYGHPREVTDPDEKDRAQAALVDHVARGRAQDARMPNQRELEQTTILAIELEEVSAKVRTGPPNDAAEDLELPVWAGVLPLRVVPGEPEPAPDLRPGLDTPDYVTAYRR